MRLSVVSGDITTIAADAILNAASPRVRGGGGVDGAIHRAGGRAILRDCVTRFPHGLPVGAAGWTTAGDLPARWVIHVVGPNRAAGQTDPALLAAGYRHALAVADELGARTLASPLISAGVYGWPIEDAARVAMETLGGAATRVHTLTMVAFSDAAYRALAAALEQAAAAG